VADKVGGEGVAQVVRGKATAKAVFAAQPPERVIWRAGVHPPAAALIVGTADGVIRRTRNLCISCLLEAVRDGKRTVDLDTVNAVLIQPHWRNDYDLQS
jgi:hypothetical protein